MNEIITAWSSPSRYIQGRGIINDLAAYCTYLGNRAYIIVTPSCESLLPQIKKSYRQNHSDCLFKILRSKGQLSEIDYYAGFCDADYIVGVGGGKIIDLTKAIANRKGIPCVIIPSTVSTDAPVTSRSVIYNNDGNSYALKYTKSPDLIFVDSDIIFKAPLRFFVAGIGDAITTKFESEANIRHMRKNLIKGDFCSTYTGGAVSGLCYNILLEDGVNAVLAIKSGKHNKSVDRIIEAIILLSGLGSENCGCGIAHSVGEGLALAPSNKGTLHGEQVAFGLICQLFAEHRSIGLIHEIMKFFLKLGLPVSLSDLGIASTDSNIHMIANIAISRSCWQEALDASVNDINQIKDIIVKADTEGHKVIL